MNCRGLFSKARYSCPAGLCMKPATRMPANLQQRVLRTIERHSMFRSGDRVAVAVSGGADSVALLRLLSEMCQNLGIVLAVVHYNHLLRGAESDGDEQFVVLLARELGFECVTGRGDVAAAARD